MVKRLLLGTRNPEKETLFRVLFEELPIEVVSLDDLGIDVAVREDGLTPEANAEKKAWAYFAASGVPTLAVDAGLTIEDFPPEKQPDVRVNRISRISRVNGGQSASDRELLDHYARELAAVGGKSVGRWHVALALAVAADRVISRSYVMETVLTSQASEVLLPGAPLSSLMIDRATGRYFSELAPWERPDAGEIFRFVARHVDVL